MENKIYFEKVSKFYGQQKVLSNINLTVERNEIFGLLGPSGAGKTTILKIINRQQKPSNGEVFIFGKNIKDIKENQHSEIGLVLDNCGLYDRLSVYDNLFIFAKITQTNEKRIQEVLEQVRLSDNLKKCAGELSKGMKQRLAIARAILHMPKILFLDEPTTGLDPTTAEKIYDIIFELKNRGTTIFLTTHNMEEATKLCNHVALINSGKIIEYGTPQGICDKYNMDKSIKIILQDGSKHIINNSIEDADKICNYVKAQKIKSIHSMEPNLETVFVTLTGRNLQ